MLAVTHDVFIAVASNLFAILGLRSLFFVVKGAMGSRYLNAGLAAILSFVGIKMLAGAMACRLDHGVPGGDSGPPLSASVGASLAHARRHGR